MAASDAKPVPKKNQAYRLYFPILDADGDGVSSATIDSGLASGTNKALLSGDGGSAANSTNNVTEVSGMQGTYYLDLTAAETNVDALCITIRTTTAGAKNTYLVLYPEEAGDIRVNVTQISDDASAADNLESAYDGTGYVDGTAQAGAAGSITLASSAHSVQNDFYKGALVAIISGTGAGQAARLITGYTASTRVATVYPNWVVNPDSTSTYVLIPWGALGRIFSEAMDDMLKRDLTGITGEAQRSWLNSIRFGVNKIDISGATLTVYKENDLTPAFTMTITFNAAQLPIATLDP